MFPTGVTQTTGDVKNIFPIPPELAGFELMYARMRQTTAGTVGSLLTVDIAKNAAGTSMLSTLLTCDVGEVSSKTALNPVAFKTDGTEDVADDDIVIINVDGLHDTAGVGLMVVLGFRLK